jgi:carbon-monoxide dehydrogenase small subunit
MSKITLAVNGKAQSADIQDQTLLVNFLRDHLGLTGTHVGCDTSQCGACTVIMDGDAVKSCTVLAVAADGASVTTVEGLATGEKLHEVQQAFHECHGLQCGFCTPGMIMAAVALIRRHDGVLDERAVRHGLEGNLCRCTGYHNIVKAVLKAAEQYRARRELALEPSAS